MALSKLQQRFVEEYPVDCNQTQAAIRAGYSPKTAGIRGVELMKKPEVAAAIQLAQNARAKRLEVTADAVVQELAKIAFADLRDVGSWDEEGRLMLVPSDVLDDNAAATISHLKGKRRTFTDKEGNTTETFEVEVKQHSKLDALDKLAKHLGLFQADRENDEDVHRRMLEQVYWRFVAALHLAKNMNMAEAIRYADQNPEIVAQWGKDEGLVKQLGPGGKS